MYCNLLINKLPQHTSNGLRIRTDFRESIKFELLMQDRTISDDKKKLYTKYKKPLVMFIGNLVVQKGLKYLLKAKEISKTEYVLLIYGDGPKKEELKEYTQLPDPSDLPYRTYCGT